EAAGEIAMGFFKQEPEVTLKADNSPVSAADLAVNTMLSAELGANRPAYGWLSEETPDTEARLGAERTFVVDPIDGTRAFLAGQSAWGVALAVVEAGDVIAAAFRMPAQGKTYIAHRGGGASLNGVPLHASGRADIEGADILANKGALRPDQWAHPLPRVTQHFRPSLAYRLCLVAEGRFDAALTFRDAWEWDIAAGDLICREAGAEVSTKAGERPRYNSPTALQPGLIAAGPTLHAALRRHLA
ncbi:MAG: 3'(2'),5'-bisphosphate nucleotidase CysQ, partial [Pseudomonadota bacterium]